MIFSATLSVKDGVKRKCRASSTQTLEAFREEIMNAFVHMEHSELIQVKLLFDNQKFPFTCYVLDNVRYVTFNSISEDGNQVELFSIEHEFNKKVIDHYYKWVHQYTYKTSNAFLFPNNVDKALRIFERINNTHLLQKVSSVSESNKMWYQARIKNEIVQPLDSLKTNTVYNIYLIHEDASVDDKPVGYFKASSDKVVFSIISDQRPPSISPAKKAQLLQLNSKPELIKPLSVPKGNPFEKEVKVDKSNDSTEILIASKLALLQNRFKGAKVIKQENVPQKEDLFAEPQNKEVQVVVIQSRECMFDSIRRVGLVIATLMITFLA